MAERARVGQDQEVDDSAFVFSPLPGPAAELKPHSPEIRESFVGSWALSTYSALDPARFPILIDIPRISLDTRVIFLLITFQSLYPEALGS